MIDESTDNSCVKHLAIVSRFVENDIVHDQFLDLIPISNSTATYIYDVIVGLFYKYNRRL